jgi:RNA polymerase sigma factor (sigma-70 family)
MAAPRAFFKKKSPCRDEVNMELEPDERLNNISTNWDVLRLASEGSPDAAQAAQQLLLQRYNGAVYRYLMALVRDRALADELTSDFALGLIRGEFRAADPERGQFRRYLKAALRHMVSRYFSGRKKGPPMVPLDSAPLGALAAADETADRLFEESWRAELLARTWRALEKATPTYYQVMRFKFHNPNMKAPQIAQRLSPDQGPPRTADWVRQTLGRARTRFADLLLQEVAYSLQSPTLERLAEELQDLNLLKYCQEALGRYHSQGK